MNTSAIAVNRDAVNRDGDVVLSLTEYEQLKSDSTAYHVLMAAGVDDWNGYGFFLTLLDEIRNR